MYSNPQIRNKRATFEFEIIEKLIAGIVLTGTEIKSIRLGKANFLDAYCHFVNGELWVKGLNISEYDWGTYNNHDPRQERKLLLNRKELSKLSRQSQEKGLTIVALKLFINDKGYAKLEIAIARGKKTHDKRENLKEKDAKREMDRFSKR
ncbi:MAG: SsrA-binding protein SmpB [Bacteroidales bacterium]|nr:MAG: SsrA-binding protein SmpB [Bacteroidales bacterium]